MPAWSELTLRAYARSERTAIIDADYSWTGAELLDHACGGGRWLADLGVPPGCAVPALVTNSAMSAALLIAGAATGRPLSPLNPRSTVREILACEFAMGAPVMVAQQEFATLATEVARMTGARLAWIEEAPATGPPLPRDVPPRSTAFVLHTSGTTGRPKRVVATQEAMAARVACNARLLDLDGDSVFASASGFHHIGGVGNLAVALGLGATVACVPAFSIATWQELPALGVTHVQTVPSMIEMLLAADALTIPGLRVLMYGGSPIRPETLRRLTMALPDTDIVNLFGQTEGSPLTCLTPADHRSAAGAAEHLLDSVGRPVAGVQIRLADCDKTGAGEVLARASHLFMTDSDGWLHTGDLARCDEDGYVYLVGRKGDKIIRGGENVYPIEVENVLIRHPSVADVAVKGIPDERLGETVRAFIVPVAPNQPPDHEELRAFAREHLAGFKVPASWVFIGEIPRNANGKVLRQKLADIPELADTPELNV